MLTLSFNTIMICFSRSHEAPVRLSADVGKVPENINQKCRKARQEKGQSEGKKVVFAGSFENILNIKLKCFDLHCSVVFSATFHPVAFAMLLAFVCKKVL